MYFGDITIAIQIHCKSVEHTLLRSYYPLLLLTLKLIAMAVQVNLKCANGIIVVYLKCSKLTFINNGKA